MPITEEAQSEAAVVRPLMLKPSRMMTPAQRKPMPVTMPWITRVVSPVMAARCEPPNQAEE
jgi:hypothetical protein